MFEGVLAGDTIFPRALTPTLTLSGFEALLAQPGPWIAGLDLPFGQARRFVENANWPRSWKGYVARVGGMTREAFRAELDAYRKDRPMGDREHRRAVDKDSRAISPQKLYGVPVALMFFEGVPRLARSGAFVPGLQDGDPERVVVEAYPGVLARRLIGRRSYKNDDRAKQTPALLAARRDILQLAQSPWLPAHYGVRLALTPETSAAIAADGSGDQLDALLCAVQAAWAWTRRAEGFGRPPDFDPLEGWIADPSLCGG